MVIDNQSVEYGSFNYSTTGSDTSPIMQFDRQIVTLLPAIPNAGMKSVQPSNFCFTKSVSQYSEQPYDSGVMLLLAQKNGSEVGKQIYLTFDNTDIGTVYIIW